MAEEPPSPPPQEQTHPPPPPPPYVEVNCRSSGKTRRFAAGTDAGFAVSLINRKLKGTVPVALHIEAVKDGEEPIAFGPNSILVSFGEGWILHTVTQSDLNFIFPEGVVKNGDVPHMATQAPPLVSGVTGPKRRVSKPVSFLYFVKIVFAFLLIFVLGAIFTLLLDNLPALILFVKSII